MLSTSDYMFLFFQSRVDYEVHSAILLGPRVETIEGIEPSVDLRRFGWEPFPIFNLSPVARHNTIIYYLNWGWVTADSIIKD